MRFINYFSGGYIGGQGVIAIVKDGIATDAALFLIAGIILVGNGVLDSVREYHEDRRAR